ncbi:hypothetical protein D3C77_712670 [compost metagenome]
MFTVFPDGSFGGITIPHSKLFPTFFAIVDASNKPIGYMPAFPAANIWSIGMLFAAASSGIAPAFTRSPNNW